jgi:hypothetical protein
VTAPDEVMVHEPGACAGRSGRPEKHPRRRVLDAIFYLVRGIPPRPRRYDHSRHDLDRSPNYLLATVLTSEQAAR